MNNIIKLDFVTQNPTRTSHSSIMGMKINNIFFYLLKLDNFTFNHYLIHHKLTCFIKIQIIFKFYEKTNRHFTKNKIQSFRLCLIFFFKHFPVRILIILERYTLINYGSNLCQNFDSYT